MMSRVAVQLQYWFGALAYWFARASRRLVGRRIDLEPGPPVIAVLCESFVRYGVAQSIGLHQAGARVVLYYVDRLNEFADDERERASVLEQATEHGIEVVELPKRSLAHLWRHTFGLHADLARRGTHVLIVHAHIDPRYATLGLRFPVLSFVHDPRPHSGDFESMFPAPVRLMARLSEAFSVRLLLHSARLVPGVIPMLRAVPVTLVPHGAQTRSAAVPVPEQPRLVLTGRLMEYKGIDTALAAFAMVRAQRPDATLVLAGRGQMGDEIRAKSPDGVELFDRYIPEAELDALIDSARLILLPYRDATQSGIGLQALGRGIPCVVSDAGALPDLVPPDMTSLVAPRGDADALAAAILRWIDHDDELRARVLAFANQRFHWAAVGAGLLDELRAVGLVPSAQT